MIQYQNVSLITIINEIIGRLRLYRNTVNIDWMELVHIINRSIVEAVSITHPFMPEAYVEQLNVVNGAFLGERFIEPIKVMVMTREGWLREARYVSPPEVYDIVNNLNTTYWVKTTTPNPVYTIFGNTIYMAELLERTGDTAVDVNCDIFWQNTTGVLHAYMFPQELRNNTDIVSLPYEALDIVYVLSLIRLAMPGEDKNYLQMLTRELMGIKSSLYQRYKTAQSVQEADLQTFIPDSMFKNVVVKRR